MIVHLQDQVGAAVQQGRDVLRHADGNRPRRPAAQSPRRQKSRSAETGIAGAGIPLASGPGWCPETAGYDAPPWDSPAACRAPAPSGRARQVSGSQNIGTDRSPRRGRRNPPHLRLQVRLAELPSVGESAAAAAFLPDCPPERPRPPTVASIAISRRSAFARARISAHWEATAACIASRSRSRSVWRVWPHRHSSRG